MVKVSWVVDVELITDWLAGLDDRSHELLIAALELLAERGPLLGRPLVDTVTSSRHNNMKELRPGSAGRTELRALFAFDPQRAAIMLVAGDKRGQWKRWYDQNIPIADDLFDTHLNKLKQTKQQKGRKRR
ncbi:MAG: type II toxin-antitoxin system RelE/ParE family toxin [Mycobacterium sp.]|uniref:type II toxin-antitoxin system RelE/ParE family toxin n=1 Tax=Mycobacterium sp. TaxID=1785 RepID=UPI003F96D215